MKFWKWQQIGSKPVQMLVSSMFTHPSWEALTLPSLPSERTVPDPILVVAGEQFRFIFL
jgi:hypothetical protein